MTMEISDNPELQTHLVAQMGQGATASNLEAPRLADVASFRAQSVSGKGDERTAALTDEFGNSQRTMSQPEVHNSGNAQQSDRSGHNVPVQQKNGDGDNPEESSMDAAQKQAQTDKDDAEARKQEKISSLQSRLQQMQQRLSSVDVQISSLEAGQNSGSGEDASAKIGQLSSERNMLVSMVQSLQQQLATAQAE